MYLSSIMLNHRHKEAYRELSDPYQLHRTVQSGFPADMKERAALFRLDPIGPGRTQLLVQSSVKPAWYLPADYALDVRVKEYNPSFAPGGTYRFRLTANPVTVDHGRRKPIRSVDDQMEWLNRQARKGGFRLFSAEPRSAKNMLGVKTVPKPNGGEDVFKITVYTVIFEGYLNVVDPGKFSEMIAKGVGRSRAFGCGLMTVAPMDWGAA